jgi:hypothetical protein
MYAKHVTRLLATGCMIAAATVPAVAQAKPNGQFRFCAPTATVCNTLQPQPASSTNLGRICSRAASSCETLRPRPATRTTPFCAPTATVCDTLVPTAPARSGTTADQERDAAAISVRTANAMQRSAVQHGQANSALSNPYIEQKVTTPESVGINGTGVPAGGF